MRKKMWTSIYIYAFWVANLEKEDGFCLEIGRDLLSDYAVDKRVDGLWECFKVAYTYSEVISIWTKLWLLLVRYYVLLRLL